MPQRMQFTGTVVKGEGIAGKLFGTPTANLAVPALTSGMAPGVYLGEATISAKDGDGQVYDAAVYFNDPTKKIEVHLLDADLDLLGKTMTVHLRQKVSAHVGWESEDQMREKIVDDLKKIRALLSAT